jgi:hypothetical protein
MSTELLKNVEIAAGNVRNVEIVNVFGYNPDIDTSTYPEDIWSTGGLYTGHPRSTTQTIQIFSSSTADTSAGTGARTVRISGLKTTTSEEYEEETLTMNGTTIVTSVDSWYRVNRIWVVTAGSSGSNTGTITVRHSTTTTNVFGIIEPLRNQSTIMCYTIPFNRTGYITSYNLIMSRNNGSDGSGNISLRIRDTLADVNSVYRTRAIISMTTSSPYQINLDTYIRLESGSDIRFRVDYVSDNNTIMSGSFSIILVA